MKKVEAVIRPDALNEFKGALYELGIGAITVSEVLDHEKWQQRRQSYRGTPYELDLTPKVKLEILVSDEELEEVIAALSKISAAHKACTNGLPTWGEAARAATAAMAASPVEWSLERACPLRAYWLG